MGRWRSSLRVGLIGGDEDWSGADEETCGEIGLVGAANEEASDDRRCDKEDDYDKEAESRGGNKRMGVWRWLLLDARSETYRHSREHNFWQGHRRWRWCIKKSWVLMKGDIGWDNILPLARQIHPVPFLSVWVINKNTFDGSWSKLREIHSGILNKGHTPKNSWKKRKQVTFRLKML